MGERFSPEPSKEFSERQEDETAAPGPDDERPAVDAEHKEARPELKPAEALGRERSLLERFRGRAGDIAKILTFVSAFAAADMAPRTAAAEERPEAPVAAKAEKKEEAPKSEAGRGKQMLKEMAKLQMDLLTGDFKETSEVPKIYLDIAAKFGNMDDAKFLEMHGRLTKGEAESGKGKVMKYGNRELPAMSAADFAKFLKEKAPGIHQHYVDQFRKNGQGGCVPISEEVNRALQAMGAKGEQQIIPGHAFSLVNVEGVVYDVDATFNQFTEETVMTKAGPPPMKGVETGLIIMPLESAYDAE